VLYSRLKNVRQERKSSHSDLDTCMMCKGRLDIWVHRKITHPCVKLSTGESSEYDANPVVKTESLKLPRDDNKRLKKHQAYGFRQKRMQNVPVKK